MGGRRREIGHRRRVGAWLLALTLSATAAGCSRADPPADDGRDPLADAVESGAPAAPDVVRDLRALLAERGRAVLAGDRARFLAGVDDADPAFLAGQRTVVDNLAQLPLARYDVRLVRRSLVRDGDGWWAEVLVRTRVRGFDDAPSQVRHRYRFTEAGGEEGGEEGGQLRIAAVSDAAWDAEHEVRPEPWDLAPIRVRRGAGVLLVLDDGSAAGGERLLRSAERAVAEVRRELPQGWPGAAVVVALSDPSFLAAQPALPGGARPEDQDAVAAGVPVRPGDATRAATRVVLAPASLPRDRFEEAEVTRLLRHELTHVALGGAAEALPVWLDEGLAELVATEPLAPADRTVPRAALREARAIADGTAEAALPADDTFFTADPEVAYARAWWACEYLRATAGERAPWQLAESLARGGDLTAGLQRLVGVDEAGLARRSARLLVRTYG